LDYCPLSVALPYGERGEGVSHSLRGEGGERPARTGQLCGEAASRWPDQSGLSPIHSSGW
jgi:hypothetical protein